MINRNKSGELPYRHTVNAKLSRKLPVWKELLDIAIKDINIPIENTTIRVHDYMPVVKFELRIDMKRL